jgi:CRP/FNR family cyclic AMP-dependent transcriptional regulator
MESLKQTLADHPFFEGIDPGHLEFIAQGASEQSFEADELIFQEGDEAETFYLIRQGSVMLSTFIPGKGFANIESLGEGEVLGWSWLIPPYQWHFSARAIQPTQVIVLDGVQLRQRSEEDHEFGFEFYKRLALIVGQRLRATRMRLG